VGKLVIDKTEKIFLSQEEKDAKFNVRDGFIYGTMSNHITYGTFELKSQMARRLIFLFIGTNVFVALLVCFLAWLDYHMLDLDPKYVDVRLIDRSVIMSLIGATTVQVGIIAIALFGSLFPKDQNPPNSK
jgi:hypothetical protein